ncbi:MAG: protease complex subunit PrcB family protein [Candidatus Thorarchaeota archaeon]
MVKASVKVIAGSAICIGLVASSLILLGPNLPLLLGVDVPFEEIDKGDKSSGYTLRANLTIRDAAAWECLWLEIHGGGFSIPELPAINFTSETIIAVFRGYCGGGGFWTRITRIISTSTYYMVYVEESLYGDLTEVITYPYHIVKISDVPVNMQFQFTYNAV